MDLLTPKLDFVFKKLFTCDTDLLVNLLNSVLQLPENRQIRSVKVKNPTILPEDITKKFIILDILATDESGHIFEIEMQLRQYDWYSKRNMERNRQKPGGTGCRVRFLRNCSRLWGFRYFPIFR